MKEIFRHWAEFCGLTFSDLVEQEHFFVIELDSFSITMHDLKWLESYIEKHQLKLEIFSIDTNVVKRNYTIEVWLVKNDDYEN